MTEKRYILSHNGKEDGILDKTNDKGYYGFELARLVNELSEENEQLKRQNKHLSNIIECLEKGSCRSIDSFLDSYCADELLNEYGLNEDDLFYGDVE